MTSSFVDRYIADGFKDDCMTLLSKFSATSSARFCDFVTVWQEMKFSTVYCGLNTFAELLEFTEEALTISKQLFLPPNSEIARIGALYLVYGVYTQQPTRGLVKIRMTPDEWIHTINFIDSVREFGFADANFIFHFLCYSGAFTFTVSSKEYGLERSYRKHQITSSLMREMMQCKSRTTNQLLQPVFEDINVEELEKIRKSYENCKSILKRKEENQGMEFTSVTPSEDIVETLRKVVDPFTSRQADASTSRTANTAGSLAEPSTSVTGDDNIGTSRHALKRKAFELQSLGQNHLKSCLSMPDVTEPAVEAPSISEPEGNPKKREEPLIKNILRSDKKRKKVKVMSPPEENSSSAISSTKEDVDQASSISPLPEESSQSQNNVRRSKRARKATEKILLAKYCTK